jgi:hypothetical protein
LKSGERSMHRLSSSSTRPSEWEISRAMPARLLARSRRAEAGAGPARRGFASKEEGPQLLPICFNSSFTWPARA